MTTHKVSTDLLLEAKLRIEARPWGWMPKQRRALRGMLHSESMETALKAVRYVCRDLADVMFLDEPTRYGQSIVGLRTTADRQEHRQEQPNPVPYIS